MALLGSEESGLGSVPTAAGGDGSGGGGAAGLTNVTSADASVVVTSPSAHVRDLSYNGVYQLIDSYAVVNDAPAINAALIALAARPHNNGVLEVAAGSHRLKSGVAVPTGCSVDGAGKNTTTFVVDDSSGNIGAAFTLTNPYGCGLRRFRIAATAPRSAGKAIYIKGGNTAFQPFNQPGAGGYTLSANETEVDQVDMDDQFDGVVIENNGAASAWLCYVRNGRFGSMRGGDGVRVDCPGTVLGTDYGASFFFQRLFVTGTMAAGALPVTGNGLHIKGAGDFTVEKFQTALTDIGLLIDPTANARLSTGRFSLCQFDTARQYCAYIVPNDTAVFMDLAFDTCWFAGGGTHNVLVSGTAANSLRFMNSFFFFAAQYGLVLTGVGPAKNVQVVGNQFSGMGSGGFRAVNAKYFDVSHNQFYPSVVQPIAGMPVAITVDAGCSDFVIRNNIWTQATTGLADSSGNVAKSIGGNIGVNTVSLNTVAVLSAGSGQAEGATAVYMDNAASGGGLGSLTPFRYPSSARIVSRLWLCAPNGSGSNAVTATLMKNGVATAMTCTVAAGSPAGTFAVDVAHPITFAATDEWDVRLTQAAAAEGVTVFSATLEGPEPGP